MQFGSFTPVELKDDLNGAATEAYLFKLNGYEVSVALTNQALIDLHPGARDDFEVDTWECYVTVGSLPVDLVAMFTNTVVPEWLNGNQPGVAGFFKNQTPEEITALLTTIDAERATDDDEAVA